MPVYPSNRSRLRRDMQLAVRHINHAMERMKLVEERAAGRHPVIVEECPKIVVLLAAIEKYVNDVRDRL